MCRYLKTLGETTRVNKLILNNRHSEHSFARFLRKFTLGLVIGSRFKQNNVWQLASRVLLENLCFSNIPMCGVILCNFRVVEKVCTHCNAKDYMYSSLITNKLMLQTLKNGR